MPTHDESLPGIQSECKITRRRTLGLLAAVALTLLVFPVLELLVPQMTDALYDLVFTIVFIIMVLAATQFLAQSRRRTRAAIVIAVPMLAVTLVHQVVETDKTEIVMTIAWALFLFYVIWIALKALYADPTVTLETVLASLCVYLLLAIAWSNLYSLIEALHPGAFRVGPAGLDASNLMRVGIEGSLHPTYFSLVTISTLGYGDIVPVTPAGRMLASLEAVVGQLYLAVLVARLVGLHIAALAASRASKAA